MKKIAFFILMLPCCYSFAQGSKTRNTVPANCKLAYVNIDTLENRCDMLVQKRKEAGARRQKLETELDQAYQQLQKDVEALETKAKAKQINETEYEAGQKKLMQRQQSLESRRQALAEDLSKDQDEVNAQFKANLNTFLDEYNKSYHYDCILSYSSSDLGVLYVNKELDITDDVLNGMNAMSGTKRTTRKKK